MARLLLARSWGRVCFSYIEEGREGECQLKDIGWGGGNGGESWFDRKGVRNRGGRGGRKKDRETLEVWEDTLAYLLYRDMTAR